MLSVYFLLACMALILVVFFTSIYLCHRTKNDGFGFLAFIMVVVALVVGSKLYERLNQIDKGENCPTQQIQR